MKKLLVLLSAMSLFFLGCAGTPQDNGEALDNALVTFTSNVQSSRWQEALSNVTPDEARQIGTSDGYEFLPEYQTAASRLPLSTLRKAGLSVDSDGRLVGIKAVMDETNERYKVSEDQAKVGTNLKQMEDDRIKRRLEEGQKILQEEEATLMMKSASMAAPVNSSLRHPLAKTVLLKNPIMVTTGKQVILGESFL